LSELLSTYLMPYPSPRFPLLESDQCPLDSVLPVQGHTQSLHHSEEQTLEHGASRRRPPASARSCTAVAASPPTPPSAWLATSAPPPSSGWTCKPPMISPKLAWSWEASSNVTSLPSTRRSSAP